MINERYTELKYFFSCYFNQDWVIDYESPEQVIKVYVFETDGIYIDSALMGIEELKKENFDSEKLWSFICEPLGCYCRPQNMKALEWLNYVSDTIKKYLAEKQELEEEHQENNGQKK